MIQGTQGQGSSGWTQGLGRPSRNSSFLLPLLSYLLPLCSDRPCIILSNPGQQAALPGLSKHESDQSLSLAVFESWCQSL